MSNSQTVRSELVCSSRLTVVEAIRVSTVSSIVGIWVGGITSISGIGVGSVELLSALKVLGGFGGESHGEHDEEGEYCKL